MSMQETPALEVDEVVEHPPKQRLRRRGNGCLPRLVLAGILAAGGYFGYRYLSSEAIGLSYTFNSINMANTSGMLGLAIGNRWRTQEVFVDSIKDILNQNEIDYTSYPSDNPILDFKKRETSRSDFIDRSYLLEIGQAQFRFESITSHQGPVPNKEVKVLTT